jgi:O-glycosyl hydrolase
MSYSSWRRSLAVAGLAIAVLASAVSAAIASTATVSSTGYQTVKGWGSFPSYFRTDWSSTHQYDIFNRPAIQDAIYAIGLDHIRVDVEPRLYISGTQLSDIVLDSGAMGDLVNQITIARNHGVTRYIMSCWSPPAVWKDNGSINGGHLIAADEPYYVNYYIKVLRTLNSDGVGLPVAISVQNEPDIATGYDSCIYTDTQAGINLWYQLVKDMHAALVANGMSSVAVFGPECTNTDNDNMLLGRDDYPVLTNDPTLDAAMGQYATHGYGECWWTPMITGMADHPKDAWISEWSIDNSQFGTTENDYTVATLRHMNSNFVDLPFNYWTAWIEWSLDGSIVGGDQTPVYTERYWLLQKLWTTVTPAGNWVVHHMTCDDSNYTVQNTQDIPWPPPISCDTMVDLVDYRKGDGSQDCMVLVNPQTSTTTTMTVTGLVGSTCVAYQSDPTHNMGVTLDGAVSGGNVTLNLPPRSSTILITGAPAPPVPAAPTNVAAGGGPNQAGVVWTGSFGATGYNVKRGTVSGSGYITVGAGVAGISYLDTGLTNGTTYYYVVSAVNAAGESANSGQASATPTPNTQYVLAQSLGTIRNDFTGWVGLQFTVGYTPITVTDLGRWIVSGNSGAHTLKLVTASSGADVPGGSVSLNTSGQTAGAYAYATLSGGVTLSANTAYYVVSHRCEASSAETSATSPRSIRSAILSIALAWRRMSLLMTSTCVQPSFRAAAIPRFQFAASPDDGGSVKTVTAAGAALPFRPRPVRKRSGRDWSHSFVSGPEWSSMTYSRQGWRVPTLPMAAAVRSRQLRIGTTTPICARLPLRRSLALGPGLARRWSARAAVAGMRSSTVRPLLFAKWCSRRHSGQPRMNSATAGQTPRWLVGAGGSAAVGSGSWFSPWML